MKTVVKIVVLTPLVLILICAISYFTEKNNYGSWTIEKKPYTDTTSDWIKFLWISDSMGNRNFERSGMNVPVKIAGLPYNFTFQFDLGDLHTEIYENSLNAVYAANPSLEKKVGRLRSLFQFWNKNKSYKDISIEMGEYVFKSKDCFVRRNYGENFPKDSILRNQALHIGSIGIDLFKNKVLIINYPLQQFCITDTVPGNYRVSMVPIELNNAGMILLPMKLRGKTYDCLFDNGSSIFQLIGSSTRIDEYSTAKDNDTLPVSSWGTIHNMTGRKMTDTVEIAGQKFYDVEIYADHRKEFQDPAITDKPYLVTGNALFWNKTIIIDFRNKRFGIK